MSGTSLDGVDAVLARFSIDDTHEQLLSFYLPYPDTLKTRLLALHTSQPDELHYCQSTACELSRLYAKAVDELLNKADIHAKRIRAIGCHGQTIRHRPEAGYSLQIVNGSLLAELTGIACVTDFRNRDIAAGGQGAPLVPAFHSATLSSPVEHRVIVNIGGIANLTSLPPDGHITGFDCGPGNMLMDAWANRFLGRPLDENGAWAARGNIQPKLLTTLLGNAFFTCKPPKSAGREQFNLEWIEQSLSGHEAPEDVQATLLELTARGIIDASNTHCAGFDALYVCGGGVHNLALMKRLGELAKKPVHATSAIGIDPDWVEALAFAWLARQCIEGKPGNLPVVTGASGPRVLGAVYPA